MTGEQLKKLMKKHNVSREAIAAALNVSASVVWNWTQGKKPTDGNARRLRNYFENLEKEK